ncbi:MAG: hypothetical protein IKG46_04055 [Solobacterium sp.]|nr:hypothetical protein [Solobacterium sp.]
MRRKLIHWLGLTGVPALLFFTAAVMLVLMQIGSIGTGIVPSGYFVIVERFSVFAALGFNAGLGMYLFHGLKKGGGIEHE